MLKCTITSSSDFLVGTILTKMLTDYWQKDVGRKVYLVGRRIHHGLIGLLLIIVGIALKIFTMIGVGLQLVRDDIGDWRDWFNFEVGGNPDKIISWS